MIRAIVVTGKTEERIDDVRSHEGGRVVTKDDCKVKDFYTKRGAKVLAELGGKIYLQLRPVS